MKQLSNEEFFSWVESEIADGRSVIFRVKGDSMLPLLRSGKEKVVLYPCRNGEPKKGDIILFRYKGRHLLHRIVKKENHNYLLQGDGVCTSYEECAEKDVIGIVREVCHPSGKTVLVNSLSWQLAGHLWLCMGTRRGILLRIILKIQKTASRY